ncbi:hypothetical protein [Anaerocolumna jejuensis]|uniref:hypothetical protein n=1 Tax=Anaerocolumna jejuensis TaxID=259063 RepID=UPI00241D6F58
MQTSNGFSSKYGTDGCLYIDACTQLGIWVANASGVNTQAVAEHVMALILSYYKNIPFLDAFMKNRIDES